MNKKWHALELCEIEKQLNTSLEGGISAKEARVRLEEEKKRDDGDRFSLFVPHKTDFLRSLPAFFKTPCTVILLILSILAFLLGGLLVGLLTFLTAILGALVCGIISFISDKKLSDMLEYASPTVKVKRGGSLYYTDGRNAVCGDIIVLSRGDILPCDARIINSKELVVKELIHTKKGIRNRLVHKYAFDISDTDEICAPEACNMLYAGSAIVGGEAVAVAVATAEEVYLAEYCRDSLVSASTFSKSDEASLEILSRRIIFGGISFLAILALLSMLTMHGEGFLQIFLMLLASVSMISVEVIRVIKKSIYSSASVRIQREQKGSDSSAYIRDLTAFETLSEITDIVLLGKAAFTFGTSEIKSILVSGEITEPSSESCAQRRLVSYAYTYIKALDECELKTEIVLDGIKDSLYEHLKNIKFDKKGADLILNSLYFAPDKEGTGGYACAETPEGAYRLVLTYDKSILSFCSHMRKNGQELVHFDLDRADRLSDFEKATDSIGGKCVYVISETDGQAVFEGAMSFVETEAADIQDVSDEIRNMGINVIPMLSDEATDRLLSADGLFCENVAYASVFERDGKDITFGVGEYTAYVGFSDEEYAKLIDAMRNGGARVAAYGVGNEYYTSMSHADLAISCDVLKYSSQRYKESVYEKLPLDGRDCNVRCSQQTRFLSKMLVHRANRAGGGLLSVKKALKKVRGAKCALSCSLLYYAIIMSVLLPLAAMSPILGMELLNSVQTVCIAASAVILAANVFAESDPKPVSYAVSAENDLIEVFYNRQNIIMLIIRASVAVVVTVTVKLLDIFAVFGENASYSMPLFISVILIAAAELAMLCFRFSKRSDGRKRTWICFLAVYAALLTVCGITTQDIFVPELFPNGIGTFEFVLVPAYLILHISALAIFYLIQNRRNRR